MKQIRILSAALVLFAFAGCAEILAVINPAPADPPPVAQPVDAVDVKSVKWLHAYPGDFPITATLDDVVVTPPTKKGPTISWRWTNPGWQPAPGNVSVGANMWVLFKIDDQWYGATWEWLRVTQPMTSAATTQANPGQAPFAQSKALHIYDHFPALGEEVGWMISTPCRAGYQGSVKGRSPIVVEPWPYNSKGEK